MKTKFREITKFEVNPKTDAPSLEIYKGSVKLIESDEIPLGILLVTFDDGTKEPWQIT